MHRSIENALEEIDSAVFSSDTFHTSREDFSAFKEYVDRWVKALPEIESELRSYEIESSLSENYEED
jgi:hypothetical protein